jgi:hypothetical protein
LAGCRNLLPPNPTSNVGAYAITQGTLAASANYALTLLGANLTVTAAPLIVTADAQSAAFPNYFSSNDFIGNGSYDYGFASANVAAESNASICTPVVVVLSLNRDGRVDLTGGNAASCKRSFYQMG